MKGISYPPISPNRFPKLRLIRLERVVNYHQEDHVLSATNTCAVGILSGSTVKANTNSVGRHVFAASHLRVIGIESTVSVVRYSDFGQGFFFLDNALLFCLLLQLNSHVD